VKGSFYEELACVFDKFPKNQIKILLGVLIFSVGFLDAKLQASARLWKE
jgi:hypothetical protein